VILLSHRPHDHRKIIASLLLAGLFVAAAGCGGSEGESSAVDQPTEAETAQTLPELPRGWSEYRNAAGGFALGLAPGWRSREIGTRSLIRSPERLVALTISADRTDNALALEPGASAIRTLEALPGFEGGVDPGDPRPLRHRYQAVQVEATGTSKGIRQRLRLVLLRRDDVAVITALVAENADQDAGAQAETALAMLRTLRTQPVGS
jgi:hypothetical protein